MKQLHSLYITILLVVCFLQTNYSQAVDVVCACPESITLIKKTSIIAYIEELNLNVGTEVPASSTFSLDSCHTEDRNQFVTASCRYSAIVPLSKPVEVNNVTHTSGRGLVFGLSYLYTPIEFNPILCSFAVEDHPPGLSQNIPGLFGVGDDERLIQYSYSEDQLACFGIDQISSHGEQIIEGVGASAYLRTCDEDVPVVKNAVINSQGVLGLDIEAFEEDGTCSTGNIVIIGKDTFPECTIQAAIEIVNRRKLSSVTRFTFNIPVDNPLILVTSPLNTVSYPISLDASTQPGGAVTIRGVGGRMVSTGLQFYGNNSVLKNVRLSNFSTALVLESEGNLIDNVTIIDNRNVGIAVQSRANQIINSTIGNTGGPGILVKAFVLHQVSDFSPVTQLSIRDNNIGWSVALGTVANEVGIKLENANNDWIDNNIISGNQKQGILTIASGIIRISNNFIGVNRAGETVPNGQEGIKLFALDQVVVSGNVISGNRGSGISYEGLLGHVSIDGNWIGVTKDEKNVRGNTLHGIEVAGGGDAQLELSVTDNVISGNFLNGISVDGQRFSQIINLQIRDNFIGVTREAALDFGNVNHGIRMINLDPFSTSQIVGNRIGENGQDGIHLEKNEDTEIRRNVIFQQVDGLFATSSKLFVEENEFLGNDFGIFLIDFQSQIESVFTGNIFCLNGTAINARRAVLNICLSEFCDQTGTNSGIHLEQSRASIVANQFTNDAGDAVFIDGSSVAAIENNNFKDNSGFAINNLNTTTIVAASENWFGDASGPSGAGSGAGDRVSTAVDFSNWRSREIGLVGMSLADSIVLPVGDTSIIPFYVQNWIDRSDFVVALSTDDQEWLRFKPGDVKPFLPLEDGFAVVFPLEFIIPVDPQVPETNVTVHIESWNQQKIDTVRFVVIAEQRRLARARIFPDSTTLKSGDTIQFSIQGLDQFGDPFRVFPFWSGAGGQIDQHGLFVAGDRPGLYQITAKMGTYTTTAVVLIKEQSTTASAFDIREVSNIHLFPNPFSDVLNIKISDPDGILSMLMVYDIFGRPICTFSDRQMSRELILVWDGRDDLGREMPNGIYFVACYQTGKRSVRKVVKI